MPATEGDLEIGGDLTLRGARGDGQPLAPIDAEPWLPRGELSSGAHEVAHLYRAGARGLRSKEHDPLVATFDDAVRLRRMLEAFVDASTTGTCGLAGLSDTRGSSLCRRATDDATQESKRSSAMRAESRYSARMRGLRRACVVSGFAGAIGCGQVYVAVIPDEDAGVAPSGVDASTAPSSGDGSVDALAHHDDATDASSDAAVKELGGSIAVVGYGAVVTTGAIGAPCIPAPALPQATSLFVVGVYEASANNLPHASGSRKGAVTVRVTKAGSPVTLVLTSNEPVQWNVVASAGVSVAHVYTSSSYPLDTNVVGTMAPVTAVSLGRYAYGWSAADNSGGGGFNALIALVRQRSKAIETAWQGTYDGDTFTFPYANATTVSHYEAATACVM